MEIEYTHCLYCGRPFSKVAGGPLMKTIDHFIPVAYGGLNVRENRIYCCLECNHRKGGKNPKNWLKVVKKFFTQNYTRGSYEKEDLMKIAVSVEHFIQEKKGMPIGEYQRKY